ncbi:protein DEHYDRATION-INDUCED 19-like [Typha angustifolia]|uniref:protein DEHYDRATION-INDUCED 19-like n=1 Tax=Typha angustifolia TaxID=59011 RepID=UPI003C2C42C3
MDSDLWISRLAAAKRHYASQYHHNSQSDRFGIDEIEMEEDVRPDFACPYCYEDHDITSLCSHLEEDHPCESKVAVCPICSVKVTRDMLNHITLQHGHLLKRCRRLRRYAIPSGQAFSLLGRDLREAHLQVLLGSSGNRSRSSSTANVAADPFLSSLVLNFPTSEEETSKSLISTAEDACVKKEAALQNWKYSFESSLTNEEREQKRKHATVRANFVQDLLLSTLFGEV